MALGWFSGSKEASLGELIAAKKYKKAIELLRQRFKEGARDPGLRLQLADVLVLSGRPNEAVPILSALADEYAREGFAAKAIAVLKKLQKLAPGKPDVERRMAALLHQRIGNAPGPASSPAPPAAPFEFGMEEVGGSEAAEIAIGDAIPPGSLPEAPAPAAPSPAAPSAPPRDRATKAAPAGAAAAPAAGAPPAGDEQEFFELLEDVVEAGTSVASEPAAGAAPPAPVVSPLFGGFSQDELQAVIARFQLLSFAPGDIVVTEGQPGDSLYVLTTGTLKAFVRDQQGRNVGLRELPEGAFFGEVAVLTGKPRSATITCASHCELLQLERAALDEIVAQHPRVRDIIRETYEARAGSLEEMLAREGWEGTAPAQS